MGEAIPEKRSVKSEVAKTAAESPRPRARSEVAGRRMSNCKPILSGDKIPKLPHNPP